MSIGSLALTIRYAEIPVVGLSLVNIVTGELEIDLILPFQHWFRGTVLVHAGRSEESVTFTSDMVMAAVTTPGHFEVSMVSEIAGEPMQGENDMSSTLERSRHVSLRWPTADSLRTNSIRP